MKKICLSLIISILFTSFSHAQKSWNQKKDITGVTRNSCIAFSIGGKGYLGLGQNSSSTKIYDFYEYDPSSNAWTQKANYPGGGSFASSAFVINGKGYVCFGGSNAGSPQKDLWEYNPSTNSWTAKATFPGTARYGASWFVINDTAFIMTGSPGGSPYLSDVWMYVPATNAWTQKANFTGGARSHGAGFTVDGVGYFGTGINSSASPTKDVWKYNKAKDTWSRITDVPIGTITGAIAFEIDKKGYLGTGYNLTNYFKDFYQYDATANTWSKLDSIPSSFSIRGGSATFLINKSIYISTGYSVAGGTTSLNDLWSFTPKSSCQASFSSQPKSQSVNLNDTAKFSAVSGDNAANYKWQINTGSGFADISNGGQYSGAKTSKLGIANVKKSTNNTHKFRCIASNSACADTSITVTLTVLCNEIIKNEPQNKNAYNGSEVKFSVSTLFANSTLQWQKNDGSGFQNLSNTGQYFGYDMDTLYVFNLSLINTNYKFRCIANYGGCIDTSFAATLAIYCKPIIKNQATNKTVYKGTSAKFKVSAYDFGTTFQWQLKNGSSFQNISDAGQFSGTSTDSLTITSATLANKNQEYLCILGYKSCSDTSKPAVLDVLCNPIVNAQPGNQTKTEGEKAVFIVSSFDSKATFSWQSNVGMGFQNLNDAGQYNGVSSDILSVSNFLLSNDNQKFRCILASEGCFDTSKAANLRVVCKPIIGIHPVSKTAYVSDNVFLNLTSLDSKATFMWQSDLGFGFQNISNAGQYLGVNNDTLNIKNLTQANDNQKFRCILTLGGCLDTSETASLLVSCKPLIQNHPINRTAYISGNTFLHVTSADPKATFKWQTDLGLGFQNISNAGQYKGVTNDTLSINNLTVTNDNQAFRCLLSNGSCFDTSATANLTVRSVGIKESINKNGVTIFPNPSHDFVTITIASILLNNSYKIIDQQGRIVGSDRLTETSTKINIEHLATGVYILQTEPVISQTMILKD